MGIHVCPSAVCLGHKTLYDKAGVDLYLEFCEQKDTTMEQLYNIL